MSYEKKLEARRLAVEKKPLPMPVYCHDCQGWFNVVDKKNVSCGQHHGERAEAPAGAIFSYSLHPGQLELPND